MQESRVFRLFKPRNPKSDTRVLVRDPTVLDDMDPTVQTSLEFRESGVHDTMTPELLLLKSPNSDVGIRVGDQQTLLIWI
jgi:hypothetical protein